MHREVGCWHGKRISAEFALTVSHHSSQRWATCHDAMKIKRISRKANTSWVVDVVILKNKHFPKSHKFSGRELFSPLTYLLVIQLINWNGNRATFNWEHLFFLLIEGFFFNYKNQRIAMVLLPVGCRQLPQGWPVWTIQPLQQLLWMMEEFSWPQKKQ